MGLFRRSEPRAITASDVIAAVNERRFGVTAGPLVNSETALRLSAVWACIRLLAGVGSTLPLDVYRKVGDAKTPVSTPSLFASPSPDVTLSTWLYQVWASLLTDGNAYGLVTSYGANGYPSTVEVLDPGIVSWVESDGDWVPRIDGRSVQRWPVGPLWHVPLFTAPGRPYGMSPVEHAKQTIGAGLAAESFGSQFFTKGGNPNAIIYSEQELSAEQASGIKTAFVNATAGSREPAVMGAGLKYERVQVSPDEAQFLDAQRFTVEQIARLYGVPAELIGGATSGESVTYANREQRSADFVAYGLMPYLVPLEDALSQLVPRPQRVKFNVDALLRADLMTRYQSYEIGIRSGFMSENEARSLEDMPADESESVDDMALAREIAELIQKIYLGVGVVLSSDEAREIANRAGAGLTADYEPTGRPTAAAPPSDPEDMSDE
jgi:HK97 family phage portal protein